MKNKISNTF